VTDGIPAGAGPVGSPKQAFMDYPRALANGWPIAIAASGDTGAYWTWHIAQEHQRNHLSRYQDNLGLAA
jgi:hypothetical protein